jgi:lycopene beta-cyclase
LKEKQVFDVAIIGAGAAGLQLLYEYTQIPNNDSINILLIDSGDRSEKSWCFWQNGQPIYSHLVEKKWDNLAFVGANGKEIKSSVPPIHYHYISSEKFYSYFFSEHIPKYPGIQVISGLAKEVIQAGENFSVVLESGETFFAKKIADSRFNQIDWKNHSGLYQHFYGRFIRINAPFFDENKATLMDFSLGQKHEHFSCFHYILPFSATYALVETTVFSTKPYEIDHYKEIWDEYWKVKLGAIPYTLEKEEKGSIPMSDFAFQLSSAEGIIKIGTAAGQVKASTGYAFTRMHQDSKNIVSGTSRNKPSRFRFYDRLLISIIKTDTKRVPEVMEYLFNSVPIPKILTFLDENSTIYQEISIFYKLPSRLFLMHLWKSFTRSK